MKKNLRNACLCTGLLVLVSSCDTQQGGTTTSTTAEQTMQTKTVANNAIADVDMGLSKTSVFDTPEPQAVTYTDKFPGSSTVLPRAYPNAPPQIPHNIDSFKPITAKNNACIGCHNNPSLRGKEVAKGMPTPIPESHYTDLRNKPDIVGEQLVGARYVCTQCHVPQANVDVLVDNTFQSQP